MSTFDDAFNSLMLNEGGFTDDPADPGGATCWGVTERLARAHGYTGGMRDLPQDFARTIAKTEYWDKYLCDQFDGRIGFQVFDAAYNGGHPAQWLQQAAGVTADGQIGAQTIAAVRATDPLKIIMRFDSMRIRYLSGLAIFPNFGKGWMNRIADNLMRGAA